MKKMKRFPCPSAWGWGYLVVAPMLFIPIFLILAGSEIWKKFSGGFPREKENPLAQPAGRFSLYKKNSNHTSIIGKFPSLWNIWTNQEVANLEKSIQARIAGIITLASKSANQTRGFWLARFFGTFVSGQKYKDQL